MLNLVGSHDTERVATRHRGDHAAVRLAYTLLFASEGAPMLYYGDEVGLEGENDPLCRGAMPWDEPVWSQDILAHVRHLGEARASSEALRRGSQERGQLLKVIPTVAADGFIVSGLEHAGEIEALQRRGVPFVLVDSELVEGVPSIEVDEAEGMQEITQHLLSLGHRRIAIVTFDTAAEDGYRAWRGAAFRRMQGVTNALASVGLTPESDGISIVEVPCTRLGGAKAFRDLWQRYERPTAIVTFSDIIALGVMAAAREANVSIPKEVSVTGFDDLDEGSWIAPPLTTVRQPIRAKGRLAAEYLIDEIMGNMQIWPGRQLLNTSLLLRGSTARATTQAWATQELPDANSIQDL